MSFKDAACHVWAIDGYDDDARAKTVNDNFVDVGSRLVFKDTLAARCRGLQQLVDSVRAAVKTETTLEPCILYGGYRKNQRTPEHMWIEYQGMIFETMPGFDLFYEKADDNSRKCPRLENEAFGDDGVAWYNTVLTVHQKAYLGSVFFKRTTRSSKA